MEKIFPSRDFMIRTSEGIRTVHLSSARQAFVCAVFALVCLWGGFATAAYFLRGPMAEAQKTALEDREKAYMALLSEVQAYQKHMHALYERMETNHNALLAYVKNASGAEGDAMFLARETLEGTSEASKLMHDREILKNEVLHAQEKLAEIAAELDGGAPYVPRLETDVNLKKALLQKDLAVSEAQEMRKKLALIEQTVVDMQMTQVMIFERVGDIVDGGIATIEQRLSGVKDVMSKTGLTFEKLMALFKKDALKRATPEEAGQGGPFIPSESRALREFVPLPDLRNGRLNNTISQLYNRVEEWDTLASLEDRLPLGKPVKDIRITARFGNRFDPFNGELSTHEGIDLGGLRGDPVIARAPGKVTYSAKAGFYGELIEIDHGQGVKTRYAHLHSRAVAKGDTVSKGQKLGEVGNTGRSTGPHLHYEVRLQGKPVNPYSFIKVQKDVHAKE